MKAQYLYWMAAGAAFLVALVAGVADHRRHNRRRLDDIGWVPWRGIQVASVFALIVSLVLALRIGG